MDTPDLLDGILLPYSVTLKPIVGAYNFSARGPLTLPIGISMIRFTWDGPERFRYRLDRESNGEYQSGEWDYVIDESEPGTPRSSRVIEVAVAEPAMILCQGNRTFPQKTIDGGHTAGMTVVPMARG